MIRITAVAFLALGWLLSGEAARAELKPATKGESFREVVQQRLCHAGRFQFESGNAAKDHFTGRFISQVASCEGHPNAADLGKVRVVLLGNQGFKPEAGRTYSLILTDGSKQGMTVVAYGPDDAATSKELREVVEAPSAFQNDAAWRKRRALWSKFRKDLGPGEKPLLYGEDESLRHILFVKSGAPQFPLHLYDIRTGKSEQIVHAKVLPGVNRITYEGGQFRVWFNGSVEMSIGTGDAE